MKPIIIKELKIIMKEKRNFIFLLLMPLIFILMYGSLFNDTGNSKITIRAIDQDQSQASKSLTKQMGSIDGIELKKESSNQLKNEISKIKKGQLSSIIVIPKGFETSLKSGKKADIKLYQDPSAQTELAPIQAILKNMENGYREQKITQTLTAMGQTQNQVQKTLATPIHIQNIKTSSDHFNVIDQVVPGMTVMFVFYIMISMTKRFFDEKKSGLLSRIRSTTVKPMHYLIGMWIPFVFTVLAQCIILFAFGHFAYDLRLGDLAALSVVIICLSICSTGIGLALSFIVAGENMAMVITQIISLGGAMVGGLWMPSYLMPDFIQKIGHFTPQFWAQHSLQDIIAHGAHFSNILGGISVLLAFGIVGLLVALWRFPSFLKSASN